MRRSPEDPVLADKLLKVIDALKSGSDIESAAAAAGLDRETTTRFLESMKDHVVRRTKVGKTSKGNKKKRTGSLRVVAVADGASRGNPGEAACAVILSDTGGQELLRRSQRLGVTTNNVAEYHGVLLALELAQSLGAAELVLKIDSELVVKQLTGEYKIKHASLKPLFERARELIDGFASFEIVHVPRKETKAADKLANSELDTKS